MEKPSILLALMLAFVALLAMAYDRSALLGCDWRQPARRRLCRLHTRQVTPTPTGASTQPPSVTRAATATATHPQPAPLATVKTTHIAYAPRR
jgi:hypothetical protein